MANKLGLIVRQDNTGLGYQSRALNKMLNPHKVLRIGKDEIPTYAQFEWLFKDIDTMLTCETPYVYEAWNWAQQAGVKTFCQPNWEFFDGLVQPNMPHPDQYLIPSYWHLEDFQKMFPNATYLPPPTPDLPIARKVNIRRSGGIYRPGKRRFVHIVGHNAMYDRNGWADLRDALGHTDADFELVVYSQQDITGVADPRVKYHVFDIKNQEDLYTDFDALILPRRYGGLCLPMQEALMAGLPVIMPDISPNNRILPKDWLLPAEITAHFEGRSTIDVYSTVGLAQKIDWLCAIPNERLKFEKELAYNIAYTNYSSQVLKSRYEDLLGK